MTAETTTSTVRPRGRRILAQARFEAEILVRNGEQLLVSLVLPVLAMLALRAARGCARLRSRPTAALALRCAPQPPGGVGTRGVPTTRLPASGAGRTRGWTRGKSWRVAPFLLSWR